MPSEKHIWFVKNNPKGEQWHFVRGDGLVGTTATREKARELRALTIKEAKDRPRMNDFET